MNAPICPTCGKPAQATETKYGTRHSCCGLHSWDGKPLVSQEVHAARIAFHDAFDRIWKGRKRIRNRAYLYLSWATGLPEKECHGARQESLEILKTITEAALAIRPEDVVAWKTEHEQIQQQITCQD